MSISNCFAQIFEEIILFRSPDLIKTHLKQFGFKKETSCNHTLFTLKETILHYYENATVIKMVSLDAEKAFDKVWKDSLFFKFLNKIDLSLWYILKINNDSSLGAIELSENILPENIPITTGVKQGVILSPTIFHANIYGLIYECTNVNLEAIVQGVSVSIIIYADEIILVSSVDNHLQKLLCICETFSRLWRIKFNANKSKLLVFGQQFFKTSKFFL